MYEKGLLKIIDPPCSTMGDEYDCFEWEHVHSLRDSRSKESNVTVAVYLPHSCDNWVIGGPDQIQALINDLQEALTKLRPA